MLHKIELFFSTFSPYLQICECHKCLESVIYKKIRIILNFFFFFFFFFFEKSLLPVLIQNGSFISVR